MSGDPNLGGALGTNPQVSLADQMGTFAHRLGEIAEDLKTAKADDTGRYQSLVDEQQKIVGTLNELKAKHDSDVREAQIQDAIKASEEWKAALANTREPSKAAALAGNQPKNGPEPGDFLLAVGLSGSRDAEEQAQGKAMLREMNLVHEKSWGKATLDFAGKATVGTTDATGGWIIPNAIVDTLVRPAGHRNIYRELMTVVPGVTAAAVDIPVRLAGTSAAAIAAFGASKENRDLVYNGYTATMYTLALIYDVGNQFLRQSKGAAEADVMSEFANAFPLGEANYIREGTGSSQPFGYTSALTNGPATFRTSGPSLSDSTVAGSIAACIAMAAGDLASRGVSPTAAVLAGAAYWQMLRQGSDTAGFWFATQERSPASIRPGTLISPFGIPVFADTAASAVGTAAVIDNLVVADWKAFKVYFGESFRVDTSDVAYDRWDKNLTGFRGEEEMGFDARPAVYGGFAQMITDVLP